MRTSFITSANYNASTIALFAKLCIANSTLAVNSLLALSEPSVLVDQLVAYPGAIEAILNAENCPRSLKSVVTDALEEAGQMILS